MNLRVAIVYNEPLPGRYSTSGEERAVVGVLDAVASVEQSLLDLKYAVTRLPLVPPPESAESKIKELETDVIFNLFEGFADDPVTETLVPDLADVLGLPFTGCTGNVLRLALDKAKTKEALKAAGIRTPAYQLINPGTLAEFRLSYPCIVKPAREDASHGLSESSVVHDSAGLAARVKLVGEGYGGEAIVEEFIGGREFNATVMGNTALTVLPLSEIIYDLPTGVPHILTYAAKWEPDTVYFKGTKNICPAPVGPEEQQHIAGLARSAFQVLGCQGYARVDMRRDRAGKLNVLEVNPNPDISPESGAARQVKASGMSYTLFIERIVQLALERDRS